MESTESWNYIESKGHRVTISRPAKIPGLLRVRTFYEINKLASVIVWTSHKNRRKQNWVILALLYFILFC